MDELLHYIPPAEQKIVEALRTIVTECLPGVKEKLSYNCRSIVCMHASVQWGGIKEGVLPGFCKGHLLGDATYPDTSKRKNVYTKTFYSTKEIDSEKLVQLLYEAAWIDQGEKKQKSKQA